MAEAPRPHLHAEPTEEELEALDLFLDTSEPTEGLPLDAVDGLLAAVVCGPLSVVPSTWMAAIWHGQPPEFHSVKDGQRIFDILMKLHNSVERAITKGNYVPLITTYEGESGEELEDPQDWCLGFLEGMKLQADAWEARLKTDPALEQLLAPILAVADPDDEIRKAFESKSGREDVMDDLCATVADLRDYWRDHPASLRG